MPPSSLAFPFAQPLSISSYHCTHLSTTSAALMPLVPSACAQDWVPVGLKMFPKAVLEEEGFSTKLDTFHKGSHPPRTRHLRLPHHPDPPPASHSHTRGSCLSAARSSMGCLHFSERSEEGEKGSFNDFSMVPICCSVCRAWSSPQGALGLELLGAGQMSSSGALLQLGQQPASMLCPISTTSYALQRSVLHPPLFWQA